MNRKKTIGLALAAALLAAMMVGTAWAQGMSQTLEITPSRGSGVSGTATLTETGGGVEVVLEMQGLPKNGVEHMAHIHEGATCADDRAGQGGEVKFPLESVVAEGSTGTSTSTVDTTFDELFGGEPYYINVHAEQTDPEAVPPGVACADVVSMMSSASMSASSSASASATASASASAASEALPESGGAPLGALAVVALLISGGAVLALVRR